jgi:hypothetical protein
MMSKKIVVLNESQVASALQQGRKPREDFFRGVREELQRGLKNAAGDGGVTTGDVTGLDEDDELFVGSEVRTEDSESDEDVSLATIQSISETNSKKVGGTVTVKFNGSLREKDVPVSALRSAIHTASSAASVVTGLVRNGQGLRNVAFADPQPVMEHFADLLADQVDSELSKANKKVATFVRQEASVLLLGSATDRVSYVVVACVGRRQHVQTN